MRYLLALAAAAAIFLASAEVRAGFVARSAGTIAWAIARSQPKMAKSLRDRLAKELRKTAKKHDFDPFTGVSIIHHESRWRAGAVSRDGEDYGLGQIRARYTKGCRGDPDPVGNPSASCQASKARLLDPIHNIRMMGRAISSWRKLCTSRKTGTGRKALFHRWLSGYGGMHRPKAGIRCGQRKAKGRWRDLPIRPRLQRIINYRKRLIRLAKRRRRR